MVAKPFSEGHSTCSIRTLSLSSLSLSNRSRSSFCLSISSLCRSRRRFSRSSRSRCSRSVISRRLEERGNKVKQPAKTFTFHTSTPMNNDLNYLRISATRRTRSIRSCILCSFIFSNGKMSSPLLPKGRSLLFIISN